MSETTTAYVFTRDNYLTVDQPPFAPADCSVSTAVSFGFAAWPHLDDLATFMGDRCPHHLGGYWPNLLERGYRVIELSFEAELTRIAGLGSDQLNTITNLSAWPPKNGAVYLRRADVVAGLTSADIYAAVPQPDQIVNYKGAHNSMQTLMG